MKMKSKKHKSLLPLQLRNFGKTMKARSVLKSKNSLKKYPTRVHIYAIIAWSNVFILLVHSVLSTVAVGGGQIKP